MNSGIHYGTNELVQDFLHQRYSMPSIICCCSLCEYVPIGHLHFRLDLQRRCQFTFKCWRALFWAPYVCRMLETSELNIETQMDERVSLQFICLRFCPWYSFTHSTFADFPVSPFISSFDALKFARLGFCCLGACSFRCRREDRLRADFVRIFGMAGAVFWWVLMCSWFAYGFSNDLVVIFHYSEFIWSQVLSPIYCAFWIQVCSTWHRQFWSHSPKCLVNSFYRTACLLWPDTHQIPSWVRHVSASSRVHCFGHLSSGNRGNFRRKGLMHFRLSMAWPWTTSRWLAQSRPMHVLFAGSSQEFWKKNSGTTSAMNLILKEMFWLLMNLCFSFGYLGRRFPCPACDLKFEKGWLSSTGWWNPRLAMGNACEDVDVSKFDVGRVRDTWGILKVVIWCDSVSQDTGMYTLVFWDSDSILKI